MAHFAELDDNNIVLRTVVISNEDILDENGVEQEQLGIDLCLQHVGPGNWIQTSYNNNFRKNFALPGHIYVPDANLFHSPAGPYPSWILDENYDWVAPVPYPNDGENYYWVEETLEWAVIVPEELPTE